MGQKGFTLIELLISISIIAILASVIMPLTQMTYKRSKEIELKQNLRAIRNAIDEYKKAWDDGKIKKNIGESGYPPSLGALVDGVDDVSSASTGKKIRFLRRIPRDPFNENMSIEPAKTWGIRSYQSESDNPSEGDDVFDVYSKSSEKALNGSNYKDW